MLLSVYSSPASLSMVARMYHTYTTILSPQMTPLARMHPQSLLIVQEYEACLTGCIQGQWGQTHKQMISYTQFKMAVCASV